MKKKIPLEVDVGDGDLLLFPLIGDLPGGIGDEGEEEEGGVDDQLHDHAAQLLLHPLLDLSGHLHFFLEGRQVQMRAEDDKWPRQVILQPASHSSKTQGR